MERIDPNILAFPRLSIDQLKLYSLGTYANKQAISYAAEHIKDHDGKFEVFMLPLVHVLAHFDRICEKNLNNPMFISSKIRSRFRGVKFHTVYFLYDSSVFEVNKTIFYLCTCQHGLRTIGCCSHVMTVVWFWQTSRF